MPSDAFMELEDRNVWGETTDEQYGLQGRGLGAFEISSFEISAKSTRKDKDDAAGTTPATGKPGSTPQPKTTTAPVHSAVAVQTFTIKKSIDKASPDLFMACCRAGLTNLSPPPEPIKWAIVSMRESGDTTTDSSGKVVANPWLIIEFQNVWVDDFSWSLTPGSGADASGEESVTFSFESILIKYCRQDRSGVHTRVKIKGFNTAHPEQDVAELDPSELQPEAF